LDRRKKTIAMKRTQNVTGCQKSKKTSSPTPQPSVGRCVGEGNRCCGRVDTNVESNRSPREKTKTSLGERSGKPHSHIGEYGRRQGEEKRILARKRDTGDKNEITT